MAENNRNNYKEESEFIEKLVNIRRVVKVVKGGRIFGFSALVVAVSYTHLTLPTKRIV